MTWGNPLLPEEGCHEVAGWWEQTCLRTFELANAFNPNAIRCS